MQLKVPSVGKFAGEIASLPGKPEWLKQGEIMRLKRGAFCPQEFPRNITAAESDKYLCWKRGGCASSAGCQDTFWYVSGYCNEFSCHLKPSSTVCPPSCHTISAGCWSLPPELLHPLSHWDVFLSKPQRKGEEVREKQFHRNFLGCFSNLIWQLIFLKQPREGAVFWVYFLFHFADLVHLDSWSWVSECFRSLHSEWAGPWNGFVWYTEGCGTGARIGRSSLLAAAVLPSLCPIFTAPEPQSHVVALNAAQHWAHRKSRHRKSDGCGVLWPKPLRVVALV